MPRTVTTGIVTLPTGRDLNVVLHTQAAPSGRDWSAYVDLLREYGPGRVELLGIVFSDGGGPDSAQRAEMLGVFGGQMPRTAIISSNPLVRGVTTAFSWFNANVKAFSPAAVGDAFKHLGVTPEELDAAWGEIFRCQEEIAPGFTLKTVTGARGQQKR